MKLDFNGVSIESLQSYLSSEIEKIKTRYGDRFYIKPEGVIDNILVSIVFMKYFLFEQILFYLKQFDPESAEGKYQDNLYERIGLYRYGSVFTTFKKQVLAEANSVIEANALTIRHRETREEFTNIEDVFVENSGKANVVFRAVVAGKVDIAEEDIFEIVEAAENINGIGQHPAEFINIGRDAESDVDFRERFHNIKNKKAKCTRNMIIQNLCEYVDYPQHLAVIDGNSDALIEAGYLMIIARPNVSDEIFANAIYNNVIAGVNFLGNTQVSVPVSNGTYWDIKFQKAYEIATDVNITVKIKQGYYENAVFSKVRSSLLSYISGRVYGLGSTIYATEFIIPILKTDGIEAVTSISLKRNSSSQYSDNLSFERDELPIFESSSIFLVKDE